MASSVDIVPALGTGLVVSQVGPTGGYDAIDIRRGWLGPERGEGVATYESFRVVQRAAGANMSVDVGMDERVYVRGDSVALQSLYCVVPHASTINVDVTAANGSNPRLDRVVLEVKDDEHDVSGVNKARVKMVDGTATAGATLDNLNGAAAVPVSCLHLADVLVATSDTSITTAEIRDRRPFIRGTVPPLVTDLDMVRVRSTLQPDAGGPQTPADLKQVAILCEIERRIVGATKLRHVYTQSAVTALTGTYVFAIYDASGRLIVSTGSNSYTGSTSTLQVRAETISATTFEPGMYYLLWGNDVTNAGGVYQAGSTTIGTGAFPNIPSPNLLLLSNTGGTTAPSTILGFTDQVNGATYGYIVPDVALSVG